MITNRLSDLSGIPLTENFARKSTIDSHTDIFLMDIDKDQLIHFPSLKRAEAIIETGFLLMRPPYQKFLTDRVDAISTVNILMNIKK